MYYYIVSSTTATQIGGDQRSPCRVQIPQLVVIDDSMACQIARIHIN